MISFKTAYFVTGFPPISTGESNGSKQENITKTMCE